MRHMIIAHLQISSYDSGGNACVLSDSNLVCGMNQALATYAALMDVECGDMMDVALVYGIPQVTLMEDRATIVRLTNEALKNVLGCEFDTIGFIEPERGTSAVADRYDFDMATVSEWMVGLENYETITVWANDPMKVVNWQVAAKLAGMGPRTKVFTYISWWDNPPKAFVRYLPRQIEGIRLADQTFVNSMYAKGMIESDLGWTADLRVLRLLPLRYLWADRSDWARRKSPTLLYNHRVSSFPFYSEPIDQLGRICNRVNSDQDEKWVVQFTNPTGKNISTLKNLCRQQVDDGWWLLEPSPLPPAEYAERLRTAWLTVSLFPKGSMWSMSALDAIVSGTPIVYIATDGMAELWPFGEYPWACRDVASAIFVIRKMMAGMVVPEFRSRVFTIAEDLARLYHDSIPATIRCNSMHIARHLQEVMA